jgi:hypothetical protein
MSSSPESIDIALVVAFGSLVRAGTQDSYHRARSRERTWASATAQATIHARFSSALGELGCADKRLATLDRQALPPSRSSSVQESGWLLRTAGVWSRASCPI